MSFNGIDLLKGVPAIREFNCPECGGPLRDRGTQQGPILLDPNGDERGAGRYAIYACENNPSYGKTEREFDPEEKCSEEVKVAESGVVSVGDEVVDKQDMLDQYIREQSDGEYTLKDALDSLRT